MSAGVKRVNATWVRRNLCFALAIGIVLLAGCGPTDEPAGCRCISDACESIAGCRPTDEGRRTHVEDESTDEAKNEGAKRPTDEERIASLEPNTVFGFACGPGGLSAGSQTPVYPPPHFVDWSPDGLHLVFDDVTSVRLVDAQGTWLRQVVDAYPGHQFPDSVGLQAALSPDGRQVVYSTCEYPSKGQRLTPDAPSAERGNYQFELATVALDGSSARRLTTNSKFGRHPAWSPDGRRIAYVSDPAAQTYRRLLAISVESDHPEPQGLGQRLPPVGTAPQWSPDGARLAVLTYGSEVQVDGVFGDLLNLVIVEADGSGQHTIAEGVVSEPSWSLDGRRLAVARLRGNTVQLETIAPDGSDADVIRQLTDWASVATVAGFVAVEPYLNVSWSPDGSRILYSCGHEFCVVNLDGEIVGRTPEEFAKEGGRAAAAWAPDGSRIAVRAAGNPTPNGAVALYTMAPDGSDVRVLVRGGLAMVAEHSGYQDAEAGKAACREGYVVPDPTRNRGLVADCETLLSMRDTLAGQTLLNWGAGTPLEQWAGIQISGEPRRVTGLKFQYAQGVHWHESHRLVFGRLAPEIGNLDQLQTLDLCCNKLLGTFPPELEGLQHLRELNLRLHGGARLDGCLSAAFVEQLEVAEGVRVCGQDDGP